MNPEFHRRDRLFLHAIEVHVKIADPHFGKFPFEHGRFDAEIAQSAHRHVATDTRKTIKKKNPHKTRHSAQPPSP